MRVCSPLLLTGLLLASPSSVGQTSASKKIAPRRYISAHAYHHALMGEIAHAEGRFEQARENYRLALVYDPQSAEIHLRLAQLAFETGEGSVDHFLDRGLQIAPKNGALWLLKGRLLERRRQHRAAERAYQTVQRVEPDGPSGTPAALALARLIARRGDRGRANQVLRRAEARSGRAVLTLARADLAFDAGKLERASELLRHARETASPRDFAAVARRFAWLSDAGQAAWAWDLALRNDTVRAAERREGVCALHAAGRVFAAERHARPLLSDVGVETLKMLEQLDAFGDRALVERLVRGAKGVPAELDIRWKRLRASLGHKPSLRALETVDAKHPNFLEARVALASVHEAAGRIDRAIAVVRRASKKVDSTVLVRLESEWLARLDRVDDAVARLEAHRSGHGPSPELIELEVKLLFLQRRESDAEKILALHPSAHRRALLLGELYQQQGRVDRAHRRLQVALSRAPNNPEVLAAWAESAVAKPRRWSRAETRLRKALRRRAEANAPDTAVGSGRLWSALGVGTTVSRPSYAVYALERARALLPVDAEVHDRLADALERAGRVGDAKRVREMATRLWQNRARTKDREALSALKGRTP